MKKVLFVALAIASIVSCENNVPLNELDLSFKKKVYFSGYVTNSTINYYLQYSKSILDDTGRYHIVNHSCNVYENLKPTHLNPEVDSLSLSQANPHYIDFKINDISISAGKTYNLEISIPEYGTILTQATIPPKVKFRVTNVEFLYQDLNFNYFRVNVYVNDDSTKKNYYMYYLETGNLHAPPTIYNNDYGSFEFNELITDNQIKNNSFTFDIIENKDAHNLNDTFSVCMIQVDSTYYYNKITTKYQESLEEPDANYAIEPINIYSNVSNGLGNFRAFSEKNYDTIPLLKLFPNIDSLINP